MKSLTRIILKIRLALIGIATEESEAVVALHEKRLENLARQEIELRTQLFRINPIRPRITYPELTR